jgi:hypothetical protein
MRLTHRRCQKDIIGAFPVAEPRPLNRQLSYDALRPVDDLVYVSFEPIAYRCGHTFS